MLEADEARHVRALRLASGARVRLTDGAGALWDARLGTVRAGNAECVLDHPSTPPPPLPVELAFAVGNKSHVMWLVEKATELGASRLQPIESERTRSVADAGRSPAFWSKAERRAVAAMKQSGGAWLPTIRRPLPVDEYLRDSLRSEAPGAGDAPLRVRLDSSGAALRAVLDGWGGERPVTIAVGPEGGWSAPEVASFDRAEFRPASLGPLVLRFETAAIAGLAVLAQQVLARDLPAQQPTSTGF